MTSKTLHRAALAAVAVAVAATPLLARGPHGWDDFLARHDENGDGAVTQEELAATGARFAPVDQDGDGVLTEADFQALHADFALGFLAMKADADRDGDLTGAELATWFAGLDADSDGSLSDAELAAAHDRRGPHGPHRPPGGDEHARLLDVDGDGLDLADFQALVARRDENGDGVLSAEERPTPPMHAGRHGRHGRGGFHGRHGGSFAELDADGDGDVTRAEWDAALAGHPYGDPERHAARFAELDTDGDGVLSADELPRRGPGPGRR